MNWDQFQTILWLRWRLSVNQWRKGQGLGAIFAALALAGGLLLTGGAALFGILAGLYPLESVQAATLMLTADVASVLFLVLWVVGVLTELQRSETIDLTRLLHLPVSLRGAFLFNYFASHLSLMLVACVPFGLGVLVGLTLSRGPMFLLLVPVLLGFMFTVTSWTYWLRGLLSALMVDPRRKRSILVSIGVGVMLLVQLPNLYFNVLSPRSNRGDPTRNVENGARFLGRFADSDALLAHWFFPPAWLGRCAYSLLQGHALPSFLCSAGFGCLTWVGLQLSYRSTLRFYRGDDRRRPGAPTAPIPPPSSSLPLSRRSTMVAWKIPFLPEEAAAIALAGLRSMARAPELRAMFVSQLLLVIVFGAAFLGRRRPTFPAEFSMFTSIPVLAIASFGLVQLFFNQFGFDRDGFRAYLLAPVPRHWLLLGKNLTLAPMPFLLTGVMVVALAILGRLSLWMVLAAGIQWLCLYLLLCTVGNLLSIALPYRIPSGSMKPGKMPFLVGLKLFLCHLAYPLLLTPIFVGTLAAHLGARTFGWPAGPLTVAMSALVSLVAIVLYALTLEPVGRWLQSRERAILNVVTAEVE